MNHFRLLVTISILLSLVSIAQGQYSEQVLQWPRATVKLSPDITVKDLFVDGLRPYRRPHEESTHLYAKHARLTIVDRDGTVFPAIPVDIMRVRVREPWLIATAEIWSPPLTISEAKAEMLKWLPVTGQTEKELNQFLEAVEANWQLYDFVNGTSDVIRFAAALRDPDGVVKVVRLIKSWQWQAPLRLSFEIGTTSMPSRKNRNYYTAPIPPPPGFEDADMQAPKNWEADNPFIPVTVEQRPPQGTLPPSHSATSVNDAPSKTPVIWAVMIALIIAAILSVLKLRS